MSKLKPCPFCGGEGCIQRHEFVGYTDTFGVVCLDCCCETRQFYDTEKDATEAWNRRAEEPEDWMERNKERILQAGKEGREIEFRIGGRLFAIREKAQ